MLASVLSRFPEIIHQYSPFVIAALVAAAAIVVVARYIMANHRMVRARFHEVFIRHRLKLIPIALYVIAICFFGWHNIPRLLALLPPSAAPLYSILETGLYGLAAFTCMLGALLLIWAFGRPFCAPFVQQRLHEIGLKNAAGKTPILLSKYKDKSKRYGVIYDFFGRGSSPKEFLDFVMKISDILGIAISSIEYGGKDNTHILMHAKPKKYDMPFEISISDGRKVLSGFISLLVVGATGTGKSYALSVIMYLLVKSYSAEITICDFKKSSFAQFEDTSNFYGYTDVPNGIRAFYGEFSERLQANDPERNAQLRVLLIDEYGAMLSSLDKKVSDELKDKVAEMLFMGRSLGIAVIIGIQRADAAHFKAGARDQFRTVLALGNLSKEQKLMLFPEFKESMTRNNGVGEGYLHIDGRGIERVTIMTVSLEDASMMNEEIRKGML